MGCRSLVLIVAGLLVTRTVGAEEAVVVETPPPSAVIVVPAPPSPPTVVFVPPQIDTEDLERRGRQKKRIGGILIGTGSAAMVLGIVATAIGGALDSPERSYTPLWAIGAVTLGAGAAVVMTGIGYYLVGGVQMQQARRIPGYLSLASLPSGALASWHLTF
ncbi:MAG: hypothetical protein EXR72_00735 [Myxococcales bacterium]|nr:hypothetical protein [Myxococcales bacterium]